MVRLSPGAITRAVGPKARLGSSLVRVMVWAVANRVGSKVRRLLPPVLLAATTAARRLPVPVSALVVTVNDAGASRSSSASRIGRNRAGALRMVRGVRANRRRIQVRVIMGNLLPERGGWWYHGRTTSRARKPGARALSGR